MQLNVLNELAKAKRRWTEKKILFVFWSYLITGWWEFLHLAQCEQNRIGTELLPQACASGSYCQLEDLFAIIQEFSFGFLKKKSCRFWHFVNSFGPQYATLHSIETLAQIALVWLVATSFPGFEFPFAWSLWATTLRRKVWATNYLPRLIHYVSSSRSSRA